MNDLKFLPFSSLSNFQLSLEFQVAKRKYTELLYDNPLQKKLLQDVPNYMPHNFNCHYHDENSFNELIKNKNPSLSLLHINLQSSTKNYSLLKAHLSNLNLKFDIIAISEAGVNNSNHIKNAFRDYTLIHKNPSNKTTKGGVAIFIKQELSTSLSTRTDLDLNLPLIEDLWIEVNNTIIGVAYKHPKAKNPDFIDKLENNLELIVSEKKTSIICGDTNLNLMNVALPDIKCYVDTLLRHNFIPTITLPTRITDHSLTLIDHINLYRPLSAINSTSSSGNLFFDISDHLPNFILIQSEPRNSAKRPYIRIYSE
jgi:hypothetical protein